MGSILILQLLFLLVVAFFLVKGLKLLRRYEYHFPPIGARRFLFNKDVGDSFPVEALPFPIQEKIGNREALFLFLAKNCAVCEPVKESLASFVRDYKKIQFVVVGMRPEELPLAAKHKSLIFTERQPLLKVLGVGLLPYAMKIKNKRIIELGVINSADHLESIITAPGFPLEAN